MMRVGMESVTGVHGSVTKVQNKGVQSNLDYPKFDFTNTSIIRTHRPGPMHKFIYS